MLKEETTCSSNIEILSEDITSKKKKSPETVESINHFEETMEVRESRLTSESKMLSSIGLDRCISQLTSNTFGALGTKTIDLHTTNFFYSKRLKPNQCTLKANNNKEHLTSI